MELNPCFNLRYFIFFPLHCKKTFKEADDFIQIYIWIISYKSLVCCVVQVHDLRQKQNIGESSIFSICIFYISLRATGIWAKVIEMWDYLKSTVYRLLLPKICLIFAFRICDCFIKTGPLEVPFLLHFTLRMVPCDVGKHTSSSQRLYAKSQLSTIY